MPSVSIIMPVYNKEKYLRDSIESVLNQDFSDFELICINDGSTDHCLNILRDYEKKDARIKVADTPNRGVSAARNTGLDLAEGKWIQFLDGDDTICREYLSTCVPAAEEKDADILFTNFINVDGNGNIINENRIDVSEDKVYSQKELMDLFMEYQFGNGFFGFVSNKLIRKDVISDTRFSVEIKMAEDLDFYSRIYPSVMKACFMDVISFRYLHDEGNDFAKKKIDFNSQIQVWLDIRRWISESENLEYIRRVNQRISEYVYYTLFDENENKGNLSDCMQRLTGRDEIREALSEDGIDGFAKGIIHHLKQGNEKAVLQRFKARNALRSVYRMVLRK